VKPAAIVMVAVLQVTALSACGNGGAKVATPTAAPTVATPPTPTVRATENRSTKGSPLGLVCWTIGEVGVAYVIGTTGSVSDALQSVPPQPAVGLARLDAVLARGAEDLRAVAKDLPAGALPFITAFASDLDAARTERASQIRKHLDAEAALTAVYTDAFHTPIDQTDGLAAFSKVAETDSHCDL
jgi:hypothetical protein